jgi:nickel-dependent lactate racemase
VRLELPYGHTPCPVDLGDRQVDVLRAAELPPPPPVEELVDRALATPRGGPPLAGRRITLIVSDPTRAEPREVFVRALRERIPGAKWTLAIATGTHGSCRIDELGLPTELLGDMTVVNHDGTTGCIDLGVTERGTPVRIHRCVLEADLVIATGCVRPHYFAGFGAGAKAIFPGLGESVAIRINHQMKTHARSRAGIVDGNPCREDLEEAVALVPTPVFLLDGVSGPDDRVHAVVAGDVRDAFREAVALARPWFTVRARPARLVVASDTLPVSASLYQAAKIAAAVAPLVCEGGTLVLAAECAAGIEPVEVVNEAIFRIGVLPRLAANVRLVLASALAPEVVARTLLGYAPSVQSAIERVDGGRALVIPRASHLLCEATS